MYKLIFAPWPSKHMIIPKQYVFVLAWCSVHAASHHSKEGEWKYSFVLKKQGRKNSREFS
jgi:hypothetical protein